MKSHQQTSKSSFKSVVTSVISLTPVKLSHIETVDRPGDVSTQPAIHIGLKPGSPTFNPLSAGADGSTPSGAGVKESRAGASNAGTSGSSGTSGISGISGSSGRLGMHEARVKTVPKIPNASKEYFMANEIVVV